MKLYLLTDDEDTLVKKALSVLANMRHSAPLVRSDCAAAENLNDKLWEGQRSSGDHLVAHVTDLIVYAGEGLLDDDGVDADAARELAQEIVEVLGQHSGVELPAAA